jgi:hypothetical protein
MLVNRGRYLPRCGMVNSPHQRRTPTKHHLHPTSKNGKASTPSTQSTPSRSILHQNNSIPRLSPETNSQSSTASGTYFTQSDCRSPTSYSRLTDSPAPHQSRSIMVKAGERVQPTKRGYVLMTISQLFLELLAALAR